jgi:hypothetical protein
MRAGTIAAAFAASFVFGATAAAADSLPNPVKTCADIRAYIGPDGTMTMDTFKQVLIAAGMVWDDRAEQGLNNQCKVTAYVRTVVMIQHVGEHMVVTTQVVDDNGVCKLTDISLSGC